eukprot:g8586.t1
MLHPSRNPYLVFSLSCGWLLLTISSPFFTHPDPDLELEDPVVHPMFLEIAPTIDRLRFLQRAFPISSHSNSSSLPISLDNVLPMCSPLSDVSEPITSQFLYHFYIKCFTSLLNRVRHFEWLSSVDSCSSALLCSYQVDTDVSLVNPLQRSYIGRYNGTTFCHAKNTMLRKYVHEEPEILRKFSFFHRSLRQNGELSICYITTFIRLCREAAQLVIWSADENGCVFRH